MQEELIYKTYTGEQFNSEFNNVQLVKLKEGDKFYTNTSSYFYKNITEFDEHYYAISIPECATVIDYTKYCYRDEESDDGFDDDEKEDEHIFLTTNYEIVTEKPIWSDHELCKNIIMVQPNLLHNIINPTDYLIVLSYLMKGQGLKDYPPNQQTYEICREFIKQQSYCYDTISYINKNVMATSQVYELCCYAVELSYSMIAHIPLDIIDMAMCIGAVKKCPNAIEYIPIKYKTYELCQLALQKKSYFRNDSILSHIPTNILDEQLILMYLALDDGSHDKQLLRYVPQNYLTNSVCIAGVKKCGCNIKLLDKEYQTGDVCWTALKETNCSSAIKYIIDPTDEMIAYSKERYDGVRNCIKVDYFKVVYKRHTNFSIELENKY